MLNIYEGRKRIVIEKDRINTEGKFKKKYSSKDVGKKILMRIKSKNLKNIQQYCPKKKSNDVCLYHVCFTENRRYGVKRRD